MQTWIDSIAQSANGMPMAFGVLGALIAYAVTSRLGLHNGARLILAVVGFAGLFVLGGSRPGRRTRAEVRNAIIEEAMFSRPEFRDIEQKDSGFRSRVRAFLDSLPDSASLEDVRGTVVEWTAENAPAPPPLWKYGGVATDSTGAALASFFEAALRELRGDSVVCVNFLYGVLHSRVPPQLSSGLETRFEELTARAAEEGRQSPQPRVDSLAAVTLGRMMVTRLRESHGQRRTREILTVMSDPRNGLTRPSAVCDAATAVYATIAGMPPSKGGKLMRHMLDRQAVAPARASHLRP